MYYTFFTLIKWNNFCPIIYLKVQRWLESTNSPLHIFVCFSCGYQRVQGRQDYDFSSQFGLVKSQGSVHCDQRGQVNSSVHNLIKNVLIHLFYCHIIMNPEGICIDSSTGEQKWHILYSWTVKIWSVSTMFRNELCTQALINIQNFAHKL